MLRNSVSDAQLSPDQDENDHVETRRASTAGHRKSFFGVGPTRKVNLAFKNLTFSVRDKILVDNVSGVVESGQVLCILGPSGGGKTTLLSVLAKQIHQYGRRTELEGEILFNGQKLRGWQRRDLVSLVPQDDALFGNFTVNETMWLRARFYFGWKKFTRTQLNEKISGLVSALGLADCCKVRVGSMFFKGLSGGQRKRLSIAVELMSSPPIIMLDEPTTGLDSSTSLGILRQLNTLAKWGHTVVATIHQPTSLMWSEMRNIMILTKGRVAYNGPVSMAAAHFQKLGFECPKRFSPAEFFLGVVTSDFHVPAFAHSKSLKDVCNAYNESDVFHRYVETRIAALTESSVLDVEAKPHKQTSLFSQFSSLTYRNFLGFARNPGIFVLRLCLFIALALVFGLVFLNAGHIPGDRGVYAEAAGNGTAMCFFMILGITIFPFLMEDRRAIRSELHNGIYRKGPWVASMIFTSIFSTAVIAICSAIIVKYMIQTHASLLNEFIVVWLGVMYSEMVVFALGAVVSHYIIGIGIGAFWFGICLICGGYFANVDSMSWVIRWVAYISPNYYLFKAQFVVHFEADRVIEGGNLFKTGQDVQDFFGVNNLAGVSSSFWNYWCLALVLCVIQCIVLYFVVKIFW